METKDMRHILRVEQFDKQFLEQIFSRGDFFKQNIAPDNAAGQKFCRSILAEKKVVNLFYEPSTRTRISFEVAEENLGMHWHTTENAREFSSAVKGETLIDTIRVVCSYHVDTIILRHHEIGAAEQAAKVSRCPIVNAGDGTGQHPTQALLDIYTIHSAFRKIEGLRIVIGGDLTYGRTARSLASLLALFPGIHITFVSPPQLRMRDDILAYLRTRYISFAETQDLAGSVADAHVVYWTRIQKERLNAVQYEEVAGRYRIDKHILGLMRDDVALLHPLPKTDEIDSAIDNDPRAKYFEQAGNGVPVRMALLEWALKVPHPKYV